MFVQREVWFGGGALEKYREKVLRMAKEKTGEPVYNSSLEHAAVLTENLVRFAGKEVCVLSGALNPTVYANPRVIDRTSEYLGRAGCKVRVILDDPENVDLDDHPFLKAFRDSDDVDIRKLAPELAERVPYHFAVTDADSYRFERDKTRCEAIAAFGDPEASDNLRRIFDALWQNSESVQIN